ncbi:MAG: metalloregulator ArsR/SmtB family transcription factor [bacterium]
MEISKSVEIIKSLADSSRLQVVNSLMEKPQYVEELAHRLNLAVSTVSFHLKKLESAGLVTKQKEQYYIIYKINDDVFNLSLKEIISFENMERHFQEKRIEKYRQKVITTFKKKDRIAKLPVQKKKKMILLNEFIKMFEPGVLYSEQEVNNKIIHLYDDYCTIRRLLIDEGIMERDSSNYWLTKKSDDGEKMIDRKEIIRKYKQTVQPMGVYQIRNLMNGKILIGSSKNLNGKSNSYIFQLNSGSHMNSALQKDFAEFGEKNFIFEIIDRLDPKEEPGYDYTEDLKELEKLWLEKLQPYGEKGYNKKKE